MEKRKNRFNISKGCSSIIAMIILIGVILLWIYLWTVSVWDRAKIDNLPFLDQVGVGSIIVAGITAIVCNFTMWSRLLINKLAKYIKNHKATKS